MLPPSDSSRISAPQEGRSPAARARAASLKTILRQLMLHRIDDLFQRDALLVLLIARPDVDRAGLDRALADRNPHGDADQVRIRELDAGRRLAVVPEDVDPGLRQPAVEVVAR